MPRPRFSNRVVQDTLVMAATSTTEIEVDLVDTYYPQFLVSATYATTTNPAGLTCTIYPGFAINTDQDIQYADNGTIITEFTTTAPTVNQGTQQVKHTAFSINAESYPRYLKIALTNPDTAKTVSIRVVGDW